MQEGIPDLWPEEVERTEVPTPLAILRRQANNLRTKTKGMIKAEVRSSIDNDKKKEAYQFDVIAPELEYTARLFRAEHETTRVYPICFHWEGFDGGFDEDAPVRWASTPEEVYDLLGQILQSGLTKALLMSLIARTNERRNATPDK